MSKMRAFASRHKETLCMIGTCVCAIVAGILGASLVAPV